MQAEIHFIDKPPAFEIKMTVSSGTYVRTIIHDIGMALGSAAHVVELIRTRQGPFALDPQGAHRSASEDLSEAMHGVVPWSVLETGITALKVCQEKSINKKNEKIEDSASEAAERPEGKQQQDWETAIVQALQ